MTRLIAIVFVGLFAACTEEPAPTAEPAMPPGFLDPEPALPVSDTVVLSGGTLVTNPTVEDAVIVVTRGQVMGWGERGAVEVPHDSVGSDMRGKWLVPQGELEPGAEARFTILDGPPPSGTEIGTVTGTAVELEENRG